MSRVSPDSAVLSAVYVLKLSPMWGTAVRMSRSFNKKLLIKNSYMKMKEWEDNKVNFFFQTNVSSLNSCYVEI